MSVMQTIRGKVLPPIPRGLDNPELERYLGRLHTALDENIGRLFDDLQLGYYRRTILTAIPTLSDLEEGQAIIVDLGTEKRVYYRANNQLFFVGGGGAGGGYDTVQDEGVARPQQTKLNFIGSSVTAVDDAANTRTNVTVQAYNTITEQFAALPQRTRLNFLGTTVRAYDDFGDTSVEVLGPQFPETGVQFHGAGQLWDADNEFVFLKTLGGRRLYLDTLRVASNSLAISAQSLVSQASALPRRLITAGPTQTVTGTDTTQVTLMHTGSWGAFRPPHTFSSTSSGVIGLCRVVTVTAYSASGGSLGVPISVTNATLASSRTDSTGKYSVSIWTQRASGVTSLTPTVAVTFSAPITDAHVSATYFDGVDANDDIVTALAFPTGGSATGLYVRDTPPGGMTITTSVCGNIGFATPVYYAPLDYLGSSKVLCFGPSATGIFKTGTAMKLQAGPAPVRMTEAGAVVAQGFTPGQITEQITICLPPLRWYTLGPCFEWSPSSAYPTNPTHFMGYPGWWQPTLWSEGRRNITMENTILPTYSSKEVENHMDFEPSQVFRYAIMNTQINSLFGQLYGSTRRVPCAGPARMCWQVKDPVLNLSSGPNPRPIHILTVWAPSGTTPPLGTPGGFGPPERETRAIIDRDADPPIRCDAVVTYQENPTTDTATWSHTVGSGSNGVLIVTIATIYPTSLGVSGVTYAGQPMTRATAPYDPARTNGYTFEVWYLLNPPSGTASVVVSKVPHAHTWEFSFAWNFSSMSLFNVAQQGPESVVRADPKAVNNFVETCLPQTVVEVITPNAWIVDVIFEIESNVDFQFNGFVPVPGYGNAYFGGATGIGTSLPKSMLDVRGGIAAKVRTVTSHYECSGLYDYFVLVDATSGPVTISLPPAFQQAGQTLVIKKVDSTGNAVTIRGCVQKTPDTIQGVASVALTTQYASVTLASDGVSMWFRPADGVIGVSGGFTTGSVPFGSSGVLVQDNPNFFYNDTTNRLGLGTNTPGSTLHVNGSFQLKRVTTATNYTMLPDDCLVGVTSTAAVRTITLPTSASTAPGRIFMVKDESGGAAINNIILDGAGAETIDGALTAVISNNYGLVRLYNTSTAWMTL